jgi:hypothetical protein
MLVVRRGYIVRILGKLFREGEEIPPQYTEEVLRLQSWKVDGKQEKEKLKETEEKLEDIINNRAIKKTKVK